MADTKISAFTAATTPLTGTEVVAGVQGSANAKITTQSIANLAPGGSGFINSPTRQSTWWYSTVGESVVAAGSAPTANSIMLYPFYVPRSWTITDLGARVTIADALGLFQLAIYAMVAGRPDGAVLASTGDLITTTVGVRSGSITQGAVTLAPGWYFGAVCSNSATAAFQQLGSTALFNGWLIGSQTLTNLTSNNSGNIVTVYLKVTGTYGTWPNMTSQTFAEQQGPGAFALIFAKTQ